MRVAAGRVAERRAISNGQLLRRALARSGVRMAPAQLEALDLYLSELLRWAPRVNLTGFKSEEAIIREGVLHSLSYRAAFEPAPWMRAVDIGSGAGFPGLVLKICCPEIDVVLIEARRRRATFLRSVIRQLGITGVRCLQVRAEQLHCDPEHRGRYHLAFVRAVGTLRDMISLAEPLLAPAGRLILLAGSKAVESLEAVRGHLAALGLKAGVRDAPAVVAGAPPTRLLVVDKTPRQAP